MGKTNPKLQARLRRKRRIRATISGTAERPRLTVFRSSKHIYAQIIDDLAGHTLAAVSDNSPQLRDEVKSMKKKERAARVGQMIAERCKELGISSVVFDRNGYIYHGRVQALAEGAREGGLQF
ncbi:MAG: 50S ribosomal protein L18 [Myxococcales bacterium]|nr:50S ribosomal protein L18 [Myxococcales bacterium]